ncbi:MAG TPA: beta-propeller fold lactonase family protein, partial [Thermoanaerobaculia bacterium]|nr:beta-propeller fold lactonase family protein [Thermoanaerobaculia bacterium]
GRLSPAGTYPTGGRGNGTEPDALRSQGSLVLSGNLLFAVNAGSNEISVFSIGKKNLALVEKVSSGGVKPTTLAVMDDLLYVVNAGSGQITGFRVASDGQLPPLANSTRSLTGGPAADPSKISFTPDGGALLVTEKGSSANLIDVFRVGNDGLTDGPFPTPSVGTGPFGFEFDRRGYLIVSEAFGGAPGAGAASSYELAADSTPSVISASVGTGQTATCWVVTTGPNVYVTNTMSGTISRYRIDRDGDLSLVQAVAGNTGGAPIDMALSREGNYLYAVVDVTGTIAAFRVEDDGELTPVRVRVDLPPFAQGIMAW